MLKSSLKIHESTDEIFVRQIVRMNKIRMEVERVGVDCVYF